MWDLKQKHFKYFYILHSKDTKLLLLDVLMQQKSLV